MDLSAVIFVVLALAWGAYLIPQALKHHDGLAAERLDESHSDRARVLSRRRTAPSEETDEPVRPRRRRRRPRVELTTAGRAARNRRRVLGGLLGVLAVTWALTWFAYLPSITPLWPTLAAVAWLIVARRSVVKMQRNRRLAPAPPVEPTRSSLVEPVETTPSRLVEEVAQRPSRDPYRVDTFDQRPEVAAEAEALADDGSLWDPLPLTLPTYVGKATARRTVRTIELTGMTSSGHDEADSALAREAQVATTSEEQAEQRRVAGA